MDQDFPPNEMRKLHIHGSKTQVAAAIQEVEDLINAAPVKFMRPGKMSPEVRARGSRCNVSCSRRRHVKASPSFLVDNINIFGVDFSTYCFSQP